MQRNATSTGNLVATLVHLSGSRRGKTDRLTGELEVLDDHARLRRGDRSYELEVTSDSPVWVNGELVKRRWLASGDLLELGRGGPVLRFRLYGSDRGPYKTLREAFGDCVDCARFGGGNAIERAAIFLTAAPREMSLHTAPWIRIAFLAALVTLALGMLLTARGMLSLESRLARDAARVDAMADGFATRQDLSASRADVDAEQATLLQRVKVLETKSAAGARIVAQASPAVVFLQGAYGFIERDTGRALRHLTDNEGDSTWLGGRSRRLSFDGRGPAFETLFTGTAFVATDDGYLLTNRHLAAPWAFDPSAQPFLAEGMTPVMRRYVAYLPGVEDAVPVKVIATSREADAALLKCASAPCARSPLPLSPRPPQPGDEIIVLGYPTGIRALIARGDRDLVDLFDRPDGFWEVARRLSARRQISPLATRGIVGQVSESAVVYDAETAPGGSGSPVLDLDGGVVALNMSVLGDFDGANMGVPVARLRDLLRRTAVNDRDGAPGRVDRDWSTPAWPPRLSPSR